MFSLFRDSAYFGKRHTLALERGYSYLRVNGQSFLPLVLRLNLFPQLLASVNAVLRMNLYNGQDFMKICLHRLALTFSQIKTHWRLTAG